MPKPAQNPSQFADTGLLEVELSTATTGRLLALASFARSFFARPSKEKLTFQWPGVGLWYAYEPPPPRGAKQRDGIERFSVPSFMAANPAAYSGYWPSPDFKHVLLDVHSDLSHALAKSFNATRHRLPLDPRLVSDMANLVAAAPASNLGIAHYVSQGRGMAAHADFGTATLLWREPEDQSLEVFSRGQGSYIRGPIGNASTAILQFGKLLEWWSGGEVPACLHRVRASPGRISIALFSQPALDTTIGQRVAPYRRLTVRDFIQEQQAEIEVS